MAGVTGMMIERARVEYGDYLWSDWPAFYAHCGLAWTVVPLPDSVRGFLWGTIVVLRADMSARQTARVAWHEAGHHIMHVGGCQFWSRCPQGRITVARFERQARDFARWFPIWESE